MRVFVVRLNPDLRSGSAYSQYPSKKEYKNIHDASPMNGFNECVNFLVENKLVKGYLPPKHSSSMRDGERFVLITITAKTAKEKADQVVGIQYNCTYFGYNKRDNPNSKDMTLSWHYICNAKNSILLKEPISEAKALILGNHLLWHRNPTFEIDGIERGRVINEIFKKIKSKDKLKFNKIFNEILGILETKNEEDEVELGIEDLTKIRLHKSIERSAKIIAKVKKLLGFTCQACGVNLTDVYGNIGKNYIEAHHLQPIALDKGSKQVRDPKDFAVLCPNCHRMIHRSEYISDLVGFKKTLSANK